MQNIDDAELLHRINSAAATCANADKPYISGFLSEQQYILLSGTAFPKGVNAVFYGGQGNTSPLRARLGLFPDYYGVSDYSDEELSELMSVSCISFTFRDVDTVTHRDVLGAVMGLGLRRDVIGDIYCTTGHAAVYADSKIADYILDNITAFGKVGVSAERGLTFALPERQFGEIKGSVASLRLDNIVKCAACCSRTAALDKYIKPQLVTLCGRVCENPSQTVHEGDIISIRGKGKFQLAEAGSVGRKGNIGIKLKKYL